jgi:hypothetical protein
MDDINSYLKKKFIKIPLSHQNFTFAPIDKSARAPQLSGEKINKKYGLLYLDFNTFYKPITCYLK